MTTILVLYSIYNHRFRNTIKEHAFSFRRYARGVKYYYLNVTYHDRLPKFIGKLRLDGVILHYSFLAMRYAHNEWPSFARRNGPILRDISAVKVAIPQDEYNYTEDLCKMIKTAGVKAVYSCASPRDYKTLYPEYVGVKDFFTVFTGYIDEMTLKDITCRDKKRVYDVGYRGRKLPYWIGRHGLLKTEIVTKTLPILLRSGLICNVRHNHTSNDSRTFLGRSWIDFLSSCRTVLGCLGGSSLMDYDGSVKERVDGYISKHPNATFEETEKSCFPGMDGNISLFALSPRHFECAMSKTCQVLVEGDYQGVFIPGKHFIELKKDFSNLQSVIELMKDKGYCEKIAEQCFQDVVLSGNYTYRVFANRIVSYIVSQNIGKRNRSAKQWLLRRLLALTVFVMRPAALRFDSQVRRTFYSAWRRYKMYGSWWFLRRVAIRWLGPAVPYIRKVKRMVLKNHGK